MLRVVTQRLGIGNAFVRTDTQGRRPTTYRAMHMQCVMHMHSLRRYLRLTLTWNLLVHIVEQQAYFQDALSRPMALK